MNKIEILFKVYKFVGGLLCDELGHRWRSVETASQPGWNVSDIERCERCHDRRFKPANSNMNASSASSRIEVK